MMDNVEEIKKAIIEPYEPDVRITGVMMQYYVLCKRELWLEYNQIPIDKTNKHIVKGKLVDKDTYKEKNDTITIGGMLSPDILEDGTIIEVKPTSNITTGAEAQLMYYMWAFNEVLNESRDGVIAIPTERKRIKLTYDESIKETVEDRIYEISNIVKKEEPPELSKKELCNTCAFKDFCWINSTKGGENE